MDLETYEMPAAVRQRLRRKLKIWYEKSARDLPWRETRDPYRIWISEIMLQQTTVAAVVPYYERFFRAFPDLESLANAEEERVLKLWEGLGYYSRARNIWKAARQLWETSKGEFPETVAELQQLAGIGRYTAGAIVSFAFDRKAPILEANTLRLYSRLLGYENDPRAAEGQRILWQFAEDVLPHANPGFINQALMELGSRVCTPKEPACDVCPLQKECRAFAIGRQTEIPHRRERIPVTDVMEACIAVRQHNAYLLRRRAEGERWAGLWDFPRFVLHESETQMPTAARRRLEASIHNQTGIHAELGALVTEIRHSVTRYRIRLLCFSARCVSGDFLHEDSVRWVSRGDFADYPLSTTGRKLADLLARRE